MKLQSPVLGEVDVAEDEVIEFPNGLPGFEACKRFMLAHDAEGKAGEDRPKVFILQSLDDPEVAFSVVSPDALGVRYEITLSDGEAAQLQIEKPEDVALAVIVRRRADGAEANTPQDTGLRANFMGPLLINTAARRGLQKVLERFSCEMVVRA